MTIIYLSDCKIDHVTYAQTTVILKYFFLISFESVALKILEIEAMSHIKRVTKAKTVDL